VVGLDAAWALGDRRLIVVHNTALIVKFGHCLCPDLFALRGSYRDVHVETFRRMVIA
jgi:hypothetical protein